MTQPTKQIIAPEAWDFRSLSDAELSVAAHYEYARQLVTTAQARKARELLNKHQKTESQDFFAAYPQMNDVPLPLMLLAQSFPQFPRAWLQLSTQARVSYVRNANARPTGTQGQLFDGFSTANPPEVQLKRIIELLEINKVSPSPFGIFSWHFAQINWRQSDKKIIADFSRWLKRTRPEEVKPIVDKGRKAQPNHRYLLKWLAALRLNATGMNYKEAQQHIGKRIGAKREDSNDVLPTFSYASGWSTAIKKATQHLSQIASRKI